MKRIMLFEQFNNSNENGKRALVKLIDEDGKILNKTGYSMEESGVCDDQNVCNYIGGVTKDNILVGMNGGYLKEGSPLAKQYPHLVANIAMNKEGDLFDFAAGQKYQNQTEFKKIGKFQK
jgi:hypothetical protein